jgi:hypothetical protein
MYRARAGSGVVMLGQLALLGLAVLATGCATAGAGHWGTVQRGVYHSPAGNYSVPVPRGSKISQGHRVDHGAVSFHDDFGRNLGILHAHGGPAAAPEAADRPAAFSAWLHDFVMPTWFAPVSPGSGVLAEAVGTFEGMSALFALIDAPGAHALVVMTIADGQMQSRRMDSRRVAVIFGRGAYTYLLTTETVKTGIWDDARAVGPDEDWVRLADELATFYRTVAFKD